MEETGKMTEKSVSVGKSMWEKVKEQVNERENCCCQENSSPTSASHSNNVCLWFSTHNMHIQMPEFHKTMLAYINIQNNITYIRSWQYYSDSMYR